MRHAKVLTHHLRAMVVTPPPIDERISEANDLLQGMDQVQRTAATTLDHVEEVLEVGIKLRAGTDDMDE